LICLSAFRKANINVVLLGDKSSSKRRKIINEHVNPVYHLRLAFGLVRLERTCRSCITGWTSELQNFWTSEHSNPPEERAGKEVSVLNFISF